MKKDSFDRFYESVERLENANPKLFNILGHIMVILFWILAGAIIVKIFK